MCFVYVVFFLSILLIYYRFSRLSMRLQEMNSWTALTNDCNQLRNLLFSLFKIESVRIGALMRWITCAQEIAISFCLRTKSQAIQRENTWWCTQFELSTNLMCQLSKNAIFVIWWNNVNLTWIQSQFVLCDSKMWPRLKIENRAKKMANGAFRNEVFFYLKTKNLSSLCIRKYFTKKYQNY